ncbi:unnamed protein product [Parascedosporium putredinis]|uniref:Uncharacterized protein n=1 Tax=Parascedosporium putredinis TaxID=1442378 RepID=A0A9P1MBU6_9PEZI|nr:unnamed protein product [Parascedosporium putredinis]CAI7996951.1 unnamed protein product [Parascedosporium putredinis]
MATAWIQKNNREVIMLNQYVKRWIKEKLARSSVDEADSVLVNAYKLATQLNNGLRQVHKTVKFWFERSLQFQ